MIGGYSKIQKFKQIQTHEYHLPSHRLLLALGARIPVRMHTFTDGGRKRDDGSCTAECDGGACLEE